MAARDVDPAVRVTQKYLHLLRSRVVVDVTGNDVATDREQKDMDIHNFEHEIVHE